MKEPANAASKCTSCPMCGSIVKPAEANGLIPKRSKCNTAAVRSPTYWPCHVVKPSQLFENIPKIRRILQTLCDVGLDYVALGQSAATLSGGEAQRVKLAAELSRPDTGSTLYVLDEPTTGLHFDDIAKLLEVLHRLVDLGNTVLVIEHNLDVIKQADWIIDIGPEAGSAGGQVVAAGTPEQIVEQNSKGESGKGKKKSTKPADSAFASPPSPVVSHTALALAPVLAAGPHKKREAYNFASAEAERPD